MEISEQAEEALETLWIATREDGHEGVAATDLESEAVTELIKNDLASQSGDLVILTDSGLPEAESVLRRHRLAERLLYDVLGASKDSSIMHEKACKFEHLLDRGLDENICTLLGHPKICPHGKPIPSGACCAGQETRAAKVVSPLSQLSPGQHGRVAYIHAPQTNKLQKLMAMGILPGAPLTLLQAFPSYVFAAGETQFAVDKEIAEAIYVRLFEETPVGMIRKVKDRHHEHKHEHKHELIHEHKQKGRRRFGFFG